MRASRWLLLAVWITLVGAHAGRAGEIDDAALRGAIAKSLALLQSSAQTYTQERECYSCHHQTLPAMAVAAAGRRGFEIDAAAAKAQADFTIQHFALRRERLLQGEGVPGASYTAGYALVGLAAGEWPADEVTAALVAYLFKRQMEDGHWPIQTNRPPLEASDFTSTALSLRGLQLYGAPEQADQIRGRVARARQWLDATQATTNEDRTFRLFGLKWSGADAEALRRAADELLLQQRDDGGWAQLGHMNSDAYATGQALAALHEAGGLPTAHEAYRRGVKFLMETQLADGSWRVETRSRPIQVYFESGFPHGKSQFISICATSWAALALLHASP
jgi:N-acyl-D-amino-acid deacylase